MPYIQCDLEQGLSESDKKELVRRMAAVTHKAIGSAMGHINVVLREHPSANLFEAGEGDRALISSKHADSKRKAKVA
jgi:phenylpyruvate tautomerase PptA (4-oxalocrotonate tautomerase family)